MKAQRPKKKTPSRGAVRQLPKKQTRQFRFVPAWDFQRLFALTLKLSLAGCLAAGLVVIWPYVNKPVAEVEFSGFIQRADIQALRKEVESKVGSGLLTLDIEDLDARLETISWVYAAEITKIWPQRLSINIEEEQPVARWGDIGYLTASGKMVESDAYEDLAQLPHFDVGVAEPREVLDLFYGLNSAMLTSGIALQELRQSKFGSWSMVMENGSEIVLGKDELMTRIQRVMSAWQRLEPAQLNELETVDARYPNGLAVRYREEIVQQQKQVNGGWKT